MALPLSYHWRNLFVRRTTTFLTVLVVAAVVGVLTWMISFAAAMRSSIFVERDPRKIIVIANGATAETNSAIPPPDFARLKQLTAVARDPQTQEPLISPEMMVQVQLPRLRDGGRSTANVAIRGVSANAFRVHRDVQIEPGGRMFDPGALEIVVGAAAARQFAGLNIGDTLELGASSNRSFRIVGRFTAGGGPLESEIWGDLTPLMSAYGRTVYSCASLRLADDADPPAVVAEIEGPSVQLAAATEADYWAAQSGSLVAYMVVSAALVAVMCIAAVLSIANTMFAAVAGRTREVAMLRALGYSRGSILGGFVLESVLLSIVGGALGCAGCAAWLSLAGNTKDMYGLHTFTTLAFEIRLTPLVAGCALVAVVLVGASGALAPAWRAARVNVLDALREA